MHTWRSDTTDTAPDKRPFLRVYAYVAEYMQMWAERGWMCREASIHVIVLRMLAPWGLGYARCFCVRDVCRMWEWIVDVLWM